jgi:hypothetical protein
MKIVVEHQNLNEKTGNLEGFASVAEVNASHIHNLDEALEYAWRYTNNVDGSWSMKIGSDANDNVTVLADLPVSKRTGNPMGLRSSMVGDRFIVEDIFGTSVHKVMPFGFKRIDSEVA